MTTLATCWKITRRDGVVLRFTYARTAIRSTADLAFDNLDVESVFPANPRTR